ncbi:MAG: hypothetical protein A2202_02380 [Bdellovibrionales bacterium RIFOXYA1_FULL_36_14]|nr:MAG: hypothetical protein A2202_02380 [Bdellovibrionales bacterium RIFOXYA1_FULL_36_14]
MIVFLCGFSGAGKTYLLKNLKQSTTDTNWCFFDLDEEIEKQNGVPIWQIVNESGISHFRKLETLQLKKVLKETVSNNCLVALGGGTLDLNFELIENTAEAKLVWLDISFERCFARISGDNLRPLVILGKEKLEQLYVQRCANYQKADLILSKSQIENVKKLNQLIDLLK